MATASGKTNGAHVSTAETIAKPMYRQSSANLKYPNSTLIGSLNEAVDSNISAELRSHRSSEGPGLQANAVEVAITVDGSNEGMVTCKVDGKYQRVRPSRGTIWLVPAAAESEEISISSPELRVLHLFLPNATFLRLSSEYALAHSPSDLIRYSSLRKNLAGLKAR